LANLGSSGDWISITRPVVRIRLTTSPDRPLIGRVADRQAAALEEHFLEGVPGKSRLIICSACPGLPHIPRAARQPEHPGQVADRPGSTTTAPTLAAIAVHG
jgi:hypothetical protein